jgi:hypothetical protein
MASRGTILPLILLSEFPKPAQSSTPEPNHFVSDERWKGAKSAKWKNSNKAVEMTV